MLLLIKEVKDFKAQTPEEAEQLRIRMLGKKGELNKLLAEFKNVPPDQKRETGMKVNELKTIAQDKINKLKTKLETSKK